VTAVAVIASGGRLAGQPSRPHNVVLFVPDGLRSLAVNAETAPALTAVRDRGVNFTNPHSLYPTLTTANASAMATGHDLGDTGNFSNTIFAGFAVHGQTDSVTPFLEHDGVLGEMDRHFGGNYLNETTVLKAARAAGFRTAVVGKLGPTLIFDHTNRTGESTIVIDDSTGRPEGIPLSEQTRRAMESAGLPLQAPGRGDNGDVGTSTRPGTHQANTTQQDYFIDVVTKVILPSFKRSGQPFVLVYWSRDPDGSQHNQGDSLNQLTPGINGSTSHAGIRNADDNLARIRKALADLEMADTTNVIVAADHGFSTISKQSETSAAARATYADVPPSFLPPGFLAIDLAAALHLPLFDPDDNNKGVATGSFPKRSNGLIGRDATHPQVVVASNGGSDLIYVPSRSRSLTAAIVTFLGGQDYVSGIFVDDGVGDLPGTLPMSAIDLRGSSRTPRPTLVVTFKTFSTGCEQPLLCAAEVTDATLQQGQGYHGSFSRADTMNFMAAIGPDFKTGFVDTAPVSNADVGRTMAHLLGLKIPMRGTLLGRVMTEALAGGGAVNSVTRARRAARATGGVRTELRYQLVGSTRYFDAGGTRGRTLGFE
jgi:arylsulfatase A-like enzyme